MSALDDFLTRTVARHALATTGVRSGDPTSLIAMLSRREPVTLFPAAQPAKSGRQELSQAFRTVASVYSNATPVSFEVVAAGVSGDLAYLVGYEQGRASVAGAPAEQISLRVTQLYRREDGDWMLVHRHADPGPEGDPAVDHLRAAIRPSAGR